MTTWVELSGNKGKAESSINHRPNPTGETCVLVLPCANTPAHISTEGIDQVQTQIVLTSLGLIGAGLKKLPRDTYLYHSKATTILHTKPDIYKPLCIMALIKKATAGD